jgi:hypothetical protein
MHVLVINFQPKKVWLAAWVAEFTASFIQFWGKLERKGIQSHEIIAQ